MNATTEVVENLDDLKVRVRGGKHIFAILLAGGLAYSRKTIKLRRPTNPGAPAYWQIKNHIDGTSQMLSDDELWTQSNIGVALDKGALVQIIGARTIRGSVEA